MRFVSFSKDLPCVWFSLMGALLLLVEHCHAASRLMHPAIALQHMRKNQYEEALFRCEDDRYELDMVIESNASAIRHIRPLCEEIMKMSPEEKNNYRIPDHGLTPLHFRCIQKIYGEPLTACFKTLWRCFPHTMLIIQRIYPHLH